MQALHRCIRRKGYAFTSLRDLAEEAEMSASHVRYYFDGKDVVLEYYLEHFIQIVRNDLDEIAGLPIERRMVAIADRFFGERVTRDRISVLFEIFGIAIHNKRLHALKVTHDEQVLGIIQRTLAEARGAGEAEVADDAVSLHALLVGLSTNMLFNAEQTLAKGHALFLETFARMAGLRIEAVVAS
jgi:AcrR family transcriptional regulator